MTDDKLLIDVLRAAGHEDAAELASKLLTANPAGGRSGEADAPELPPARVSLLGPQTAADVDAEGRYIADAMKRGLSSKWIGGDAA